MRSYLEIFKREFAIQTQTAGEWLAIVLFYVLLVSLFPIVIGPLSAELRWLVPVIIWIAALLTMVIAQENLLRSDYEYGIFIELLLSEYSLSWLLFAKILAHWIIYAVPLILLTPLLLLSFAVNIFSVMQICLSLIGGTLILGFLGALCVSMTIILTRGGVLLSIMLLPLYTPVLVLGCNIGVLSINGNANMGHFAILMALGITVVLTTPIAIATAVRVSIT